MLSRRLRPSANEPTPTNAEPLDHALGFTDIYGSLTPRQISIISMTYREDAFSQANKKTAAIGSAIGTSLMLGTGRALSM